MPMSTMRFKQYNTANRVRALTSEDSFAKGICMTNAPEEAGYAKMLVNYKLKNEGTVLATRPAIVVDDVTAANSKAIKTVLFTDTVECTVEGEDFTVIRRCVIVEYNDGTCGVYVEPTGAHDNSFNLGNGKPNEYKYRNTPVLSVPADSAKSYKLVKDSISSGALCKHDIAISDQAEHMRNVVCTKLNTSVILLYNDGTATHLGRLKIKFVDSLCMNSKWELEPIEPKDVTPAQAVNYGYNMLKDNPYTFNNAAMYSGEVTLLGVLPHDASTGKLLLTAKVGTSIKFKLSYKYPEADRSNEKEKYYTSWELYDLENPASTTTVIQSETASPLVTPGDEISLVHTPAVKAFGIVVKLYKLTAISDDGSITTTAQLKERLESIDKYVAPAQVITLASYYLTNDEANAKANSLELVQYSLASARGICAWRNKLVAWGISGAEHMLFTSDINNPGYFPYPNGVEVFDNVVVKAVPYLDKLLVFTVDALYMLTLDAAGLTYTVSKVQDRLAISHIDCANIVPVLNMVHFKSGNYYYMIVPKLQSLTGELQLAPISKPVEQLLDNFKESVSELLSTVYNFTYDNIELRNAYTYVADNNICNVYKVVLTKADAPTRIVNVVLRYDTNIRAWTIWTYGAGTSADKLYEITATGDVKYVSVHSSNTLCILKEDNNSCVDTFYPEVNNYQYLDTGFRKHAEQLKKRFREVQFAVNSLAEVPIEFYTAFDVDEAERKAFYRHVVTYCSDPEDTNYGNILVQRELTEPSVTATLSELGSWVLDSSQFPDLSVYKVRYKVSGKGYGGRVQLLCKPTSAYEILYIAWVFRTMNAR